MAISIDSRYVIQTMAEMVDINSVNPSLSDGGNGEAEIGSYVAAALNRLGLQTTTYELAPKRVNVVGVLPGSGSGRSLLLNAHLDTVGVDGMADPFRWRRYETGGFTAADPRT